MNQYQNKFSEFYIEQKIRILEIEILKKNLK